MKLDIAVLSRRGSHTRNEDACGYWTSDDFACWAVSDGAGGHGGGDIASRTVVANIVHEFSAGPEVSVRELETLVRGANRAVLVKQRQHREFPDMRATVALMLLDRLQERLVWATVGDTRIYVFRHGSVLFQTRDHSVMQSLLDGGQSNNAALRNHPGRGVLMHALGSEQSLPTPGTDDSLVLAEDDALLMCTDGLWEPVGEAVMERSLANASSAAHWLAALEAEIMRSGRSPLDNYSAIAIRVSELSEATKPGPFA